MKKFISLFAAASFVAAALCSCEKLFETSKDLEKEALDGSSTSSQIDRDRLCGLWQVVSAKFSEDAKMSAWPYESTFFGFSENGLFASEGYFGEGEGSYSVQNNVISVLIEGQPYVEMTVSEQQDSLLSLCATFSGNGVKIWGQCRKIKSNDKTLDTEPTSDISIDYIFKDDNSARMAVLAAYGKMVNFVGLQRNIEDVILEGRASLITENSQDVLSLWQVGYQAISVSNTLISALMNLDNSYAETKEKYLPHLMTVRAFVYYNMAMLWGDIPFPTEQTSLEAQMNMPRTAASTVYEKAMSDLLEVKDRVVDLGFLGNSVFSVNSANLLLSELYLTTGAYASALSVLSKVVTPASQYILRFDNIETEQAYNVYVKAHPDLLHKEAAGNAPTLVSDWQSAADAEFGYWAMLKRTGNAVKVAGCSAYQLLLPIPRRERDANPNAWQNPGY